MRDPRGAGQDVGDRGWVDGEEIVGEDDKVRKFCLPQAYRDLFLKACICVGGCVSAQRLLNGDLLFRDPSLPVGAVDRPSGDGGVYPLQGIDRRDGPIGSETQNRAGIDQGAKRIGELGPLRPDALLCSASVVDRILRLHRCDDAQTRLICALHLH